MASPSAPWPNIRPNDHLEETSTIDSRSTGAGRKPSGFRRFLHTFLNSSSQVQFRDPVSLMAQESIASLGTSYYTAETSISLNRYSLEETDFPIRGYSIDEDTDLSPANETPTERAQRMVREQEAQKISEKIDEELSQERMNANTKKITKILLLGQSESGKSTTLKNIQLCYAPQSLRHEVYKWQISIHLNLVKSVRLITHTLYQAAKEDASDLTDDLRKLLIKLSILRQVEELLMTRISPPQEESDSQMVEEDSSELSMSSASGQKGGFNKMYHSAATRDDTILSAQILENCAEDMIAIWTNPIVRQILKQRRIRLDASSEFFLDNIDRVAQMEYLPTDDDILRAHVQTVGIQEHKITVETGPEHGKDWYIYDVGGLRSQRSAWESFFDDVNIIIFHAPLAPFDEGLAEDRRVNKVEDSMIFWKDVCSSKLLAKVELILLLTKCDILAKKLESGIRVAKYVPSFKDYPNNVETVTRYFRSKFKAVQREYSPISRMFYCHQTSTIDARSAATLVANVHEIIVRASLESADVLS